MSDQRGDSAPRNSWLETLPTFPSEAEDAPAVAQLPDRGKTWGLMGVWCGAILGGTVGIGCMIDSIFVGSMSPSRAFGLLVGLPVVLAMFFGVAWGLRGIVRDLVMHSRDVAALREAEREKPGDREWAGVKKLLERERSGI